MSPNRFVSSETIAGVEKDQRQSNRLNRIARRQRLGRMFCVENGHAMERKNYHVRNKWRTEYNDSDSSQFRCDGKWWQKRAAPHAQDLIWI